jgi:hypothetical protein
LSSSINQVDAASSTKGTAMTSEVLPANHDESYAVDNDSKSNDVISESEYVTQQLLSNITSVSSSSSLSSASRSSSSHKNAIKNSSISSQNSDNSSTDSTITTPSSSIVGSLQRAAPDEGMHVKQHSEKSVAGITQVGNGFEIDVDDLEEDDEEGLESQPSLQRNLSDIARNDKLLQELLDEDK